MTVNIKFPVGHGVEFLCSDNMPVEFPDEQAARAFIRKEYHWMNEEEIDSYKFEFPEVIPVELHLPDGIMNRCNEGYLESVFEFAKSIHWERQLQKSLDDLARWGNEKIYIVLYNDFAPYSFFWNAKIGSVIEVDGKTTRVMRPDTDQTYMIGGLIFHGTHDGHGDGGSPTFSVNLTPTSGWSCHT